MGTGSRSPRGPGQKWFAVDYIKIRDKRDMMVFTEYIYVYQMPSKVSYIDRGDMI